MAAVSGFGIWPAASVRYRTSCGSPGDCSVGVVVTNPEVFSNAVAPRRRRTRRHRRNRLLRRCLVVFILGFFAAGFSMAALSPLWSSPFRSAAARVPVLQQFEARPTPVFLAEKALEEQRRPS